MTKQPKPRVHLETLDVSDRFNMHIRIWDNAYPDETSNGRYADIVVNKEGAGFEDRLVKAINHAFDD